MEVSASPDGDAEAGGERPPRLRLIHLSDIHFGGYGAGWDEDADQRHQLIADVKHLLAADEKPADGILVGGDVAFSGHRDQYALAHEWLERLREASGCPEGAVWAVPGNHDVDRDEVDRSHILRDFRTAVRDCVLQDLDGLLSERLAKDGAGETLVNPLKAYNDFAFNFGCATSSRHPYWWDAPFRLGDMPVLLWGLNSALVSDSVDAGGDSEQDANLVLGSHQCKVREEPGEIRIVLCHHPPSWLRDWERVEPFLERGHVVLWGHEHSYSCVQE